jgi:hypothetical protein
MTEPAPEPADELPFWPLHNLGVPLVDLTKAMAWADELDELDELDDLSKLQTTHET